MALAKKCRECPRRDTCTNKRSEAYVALADPTATQDDTGSLLNEHGEYVVKFATNHNMTTHEAHDQPMIKAHLEFLSALKRETAKEISRRMQLFQNG